MTKQFLQMLCGIGYPLSAFVCQSMGQSDAATASPDAIALEAIPEEFAKTDERMRKLAAALLAAIDAEAAAKRIAESAASGLRMAADQIEDPIFGDARTLLASADLPPGNEALMRALHTVEDEAMAVQTRRTELLSRAILETRRRTREVAFQASKPAEIDPFVQLLTKVEADAFAHCAPEEKDQIKRTFAPCAAFLRSLSSLLRALEKRDAPAAAIALREVSPGLTIEGTTHYERQALANRIMAPVEAAVERTRHALEAAITEQKQPAAIHTSLDGYEKATMFCLAIRHPGFTNRNIVLMYRKVVDIWDALGMPANQRVRGNIAEVRKVAEAVQWPDEPRYFQIRDILDGWEKDFVKAAEREKSEQEKWMLAKITLVKRPSDLTALAQEIESRRLAYESNNSTADARMRKYELGEMAGRFATLGSAWKSGSTSVLDKQFYGGSGGKNPALARELGALRERIERDTLSRSLRAPELA